MNEARRNRGVAGLAMLLAFAGCGGGALSDGRVAAIQTALDAHPPSIQVPMGKSCHGPGYWGDVAPSKFKGLAYVTIKSSGQEQSLFGPQPCTTVTWDKSVKINQAMDTEPGFLAIGHFVVDKVGDEQDGPFGAKLTPYKEHFEWYPAGKDMQARHLAQEPAPQADPMAALHKDADGKWVAQL